MQYFELIDICLNVDCGLETEQQLIREFCSKSSRREIATRARSC
jgi:hypothetical protein